MKLENLHDCLAEATLRLLWRPLDENNDLVLLVDKLSVNSETERKGQTCSSFVLVSASSARNLREASWSGETRSIDKVGSERSAWAKRYCRDKTRLRAARVCHLFL
jgi:hypothetical protein